MNEPKLSGKLLGVLALACLVSRAVYVWVQRENLSEGFEYHVMAQRYLEVGAVEFSYGDRWLPSALMPPGFMGVLIILQGFFPSGWEAGVGALQVGLAALTLILLARATEGLLNPGLALAAVLLYLLDINLWIPVAWSNETVYSFFFLVLSFYTLERAVNTRKTGWSVATGVALGVGSLFRSTLLPQALVFAGGLGWFLTRGGLERPKIARHVGALFLAFGLVLSPWLLRNYRVFGKFVPVSQNLGFNLWQGWSPQSGGSEFALDGSPLVKEPWLLEQMAQAPDEPAINKVLVDASFSYAKENPRRWVKQRILSFLFFWHEHSFWAPQSPFHSRLWRLVGGANLVFITLFFLCVPLALAAHPVLRWVGVILLVHCAIHTALHADIGSRFRYQVEPFMLLFLAAALVRAPGWSALEGKLIKYRP